jgi:hypothetical protein
MTRRRLAILASVAVHAICVGACSIAPAFAQREVRLLADQKDKGPATSGAVAPWKRPKQD